MSFNQGLMGIPSGSAANSTGLMYHSINKSGSGESFKCPEGQIVNGVTGKCDLPCQTGVRSGFTGKCLTGYVDQCERNIEEISTVYLPALIVILIGLYLILRRRNETK